LYPQTYTHAQQMPLQHPSRIFLIFLHQENPTSYTPRPAGWRRAGGQFKAAFCAAYAGLEPDGYAARGRNLTPASAWFLTTSRQRRGQHLRGFLTVSRQRGLKLHNNLNFIVNNTTEVLLFRFIKEGFTLLYFSCIDLIKLDLCFGGHIYNDWVKTTIH
jgi:hypothetical protein